MFSERMSLDKEKLLEVKLELSVTIVNRVKFVLFSYLLPFLLC